MSPESRPEAVPFDSGSGALPPALEPALIHSDNPILLLVAPDTGDAAARAAIGLADARGRMGHPTVLAEASAHEPRLHELLDVDNHEGLADVFVFGASLDRVRVRPETRAFDFVPVGAYAPDPEALLDSSRWEAIARALEADGERLLLFVPATTPGLSALSDQVGEAILLGDSRSVERAASRIGTGCRVVAVVEPASTMAPDRLAAEAGEAADPHSSTIFDEPELTEPVVFRSTRRKRQSRFPLLLILLVAALGAAGWFAYQQYFAPPATVPAVSQPAPEAPAEPVRGEAVETPLPFSVAVEAHQDLASARERLDALRDAEPELGFYLAPVAVRQVLFYRLLAGPVTDQEAADRLMARLVDAGYKTAVDPWAVRPTERAFHLGEFDTPREAGARVESLAQMDIPSYVVPIAYEPGPPRYRVYGGAYESDAEAAVMGEMLREAGIEATLVARTGQPIAEDS